LTPDNRFHQKDRIRAVSEKNAPLASADAFERVYRKSCLSVYRYIFAFTGGARELTEDLTAETFLRAWKNRFSFTGRLDGAEGWLIRIARNLTVDSHRRDKGRVDSQADPLEDEMDVSVTFPNPEAQVMLSEQQGIVLVLLAELPQEQREILILRYLLNWKIKQIAGYMDFPENTVSVYIHRALERLRQTWPADKESEK
jgi:RNA polymerase sigma-70 factor (ECF subfamily)